MILDNALLLEQSGYVIHEPWLIPVLGCGKDSILGVRNGQYIAAERTRAFFLPVCEHFITDLADLGGRCEACLRHALESGLPHPEWVSMCCRACLVRCSVAFCGRGLCQAHAGQGADGKLYCREHFEQLEAELKLLAIEQRHGRLVAHTARLLKSFIFTNERRLPQ